MNRIRTRVSILLVLILALLAVSACSEKSDKAPKTPQKIVSLAPSNTEILFALGLGDKVVGVTDFDDYPPEATTKAKIGGFSTVNLEKVIALSPDLILAADIHKKTVTPELEKRGLRVITLAPKNLDDLLTSIALVGAITGAEKKSSELVTKMRERIASVTSKVSSLSGNQKPGVFYVTFHDPLWTVGSGTIISELIEKAGGRNIFADIEGNKTVNLESVIERNPRVILAGSGHGTGADAPVKWSQTEERLRDVDARKNNSVYAIDANLVNRAGPRIVDGLELMAKYIHPEIFGKAEGTGK